MSTTLAGLRQPEYTGENRCVPCTVVNVVLAAVLAALVAVLTTDLAGLAVLAVGLAAIWLRGYLVPGTPELTKRYLPEAVLERFDKGRDPETVDLPVDEDGLVDPEEALFVADAVEEGEDDLVVTEGFEADWLAAADDLREDRPAQEDVLADALAVDAVTLHDEVFGPGAYVDEERVHHWPSGGAMLADASAQVALADRPGWEAVQPAQRLAILRALRSFLTTCPLCGGDVGFTEEEVESCCQSWDVVAVRCADCETHFLEVEPGTGEITSEPESATTEDRGPEEVAGGFTR